MNYFPIFYLARGTWHSAERTTITKLLEKELEEFEQCRTSLHLEVTQQQLYQNAATRYNERKTRILLELQKIDQCAPNLELEVTERQQVTSRRS